MGNSEGEGYRDGCVDGVASGFEDSFTGVRGVSFAGDDHAVAGVDGLAGGGGQRGDRKKKRESDSPAEVRH